MEQVGSLPCHRQRSPLAMQHGGSDLLGMRVGLLRTWRATQAVDQGAGMTTTTPMTMASMRYLTDITRELGRHHPSWNFFKESVSWPTCDASQQHQ